MTLHGLFIVLCWQEKGDFFFEEMLLSKKCLFESIKILCELTDIFWPKIIGPSNNSKVQMFWFIINLNCFASCFTKDFLKI